jgi:hypothetical protein
VIKTLSSGITINLVGLAATLVGLEATCGLLFAKALSFAASSPYTPLAQASPVQALDIFVVQVCACRLLPSSRARAPRHRRFSPAKRNQQEQW